MSSDPPPHLNPPPPPSTTPSSIGAGTLHPHHHHHHHHLLPPPAAPSSPSSTLAPREYRKGNWTLHETLVLITAKRHDDERRSSRPHTSPSPSSLDIKPNINSGGNVSSPPSSSSPQCRSAELRWKWVENYCWKNGCLRSQNQCNDKWDNLLRDYKKVRDYEARCAQSKVDGGGGSFMISYWAMEKHDRKERNLPSNLVAEVFHALTDVLSRRNPHKGQIGAGAVAAPSRPLVVPTITMTAPLSPSLPPLQPHTVNHLQLPQQQIATGNFSPPPPPPPPPAVKRQQVEQSVLETSTSSETERSTESSRKRRKKGEGTGTYWGGSVVKAASVLARTLTECEEKRERRHREMMELQERRLRMEAERTEISRHGVSGLIAAVNGLSGAIHALVSDHHHHHHHDNRNR